jgi:hypothetical protein
MTINKMPITESVMTDWHTSTHFVSPASDQGDQLAPQLWCTMLGSNHHMNKNTRMLPCHVASTFVVPFLIGGTMSHALDGRRNLWLLHGRSSDSEQYQGDHSISTRCKLCRECTKPATCSNLGFVAEIVYLFLINLFLYGHKIGSGQ